MTVELTDDEAEEIADILETQTRILIGEFASGPVEVTETEAGEWATKLRERSGGEA